MIPTRKAAPGQIK